MVGGSTVAYPSDETRRRAQLRSITITIFVGLTVTLVGLLGASLGGWLGFGSSVVGLAGVVLFLIGVARQILFQVSATRDRIRRAAIVAAPVRVGGPPPPPVLREGGAVVGELQIPRGYVPAGSGRFYTLVGLSALLGLAVVAGSVALVTGRLRPVPAGLVLVLCALGLALMGLLLADFSRDVPDFLDRRREREIRFDQAGLSANFYPAQRYRPTPAGVSMTTRWFGRVEASLPAPNVVPWKLVQMIVDAPVSATDPTRAVVAIDPASVPWWSGGLKITMGFFPVGDARTGFAVTALVERRQLPTLLWWAFQGGSRLYARYATLTPAGQQAVRRFLGSSDSVIFRAGPARQRLALPPPRRRDPARQLDPLAARRRRPVKGAPVAPAVAAASQSIYRGPFSELGRRGATVSGGTHL